MRVGSVPSKLLNWLLPPVCLICGQGARPGLDCCTGCEADLPRVAPRCRCCGLGLKSQTRACGRCARRRPSFSQTWPAFAYSGPIEAMLHRFKFRRDLAAGRVLATLTARRLVRMGAERPQLLVPVPLHWRRALWRGFNQSRVLADDLSAQLGGIPVADLLLRRRATPAQSSLPAARRRGNVRGAFALRWRPGRVRHVALVDDVMTTGTTLDACASVLRRAGVEPEKSRYSEIFKPPAAGQQHIQTGAEYHGR